MITTTIDNNQRKFVLQNKGLGNTKDIFCNLSAIPDILKQCFEKHEEFVIYEYWNRRLKKCSKKRINDMFKAHNINYAIR